MFFGINSNQFLKFFYNALLTGMPSLTYNPINKNILHFHSQLMNHLHILIIN